MCGCWELAACWSEEAGACGWVEEDLCSHCAERIGASPDAEHFDRQLAARRAAPVPVECDDGMTFNQRKGGNLHDEKHAQERGRVRARADPPSPQPRKPAAVSDSPLPPESSDSGDPDPHREMTMKDRIERQLRIFGTGHAAGPRANGGTE